jgi:hypothetical protein
MMRKRERGGLLLSLLTDESIVLGAERLRVERLRAGVLLVGVTVVGSSPEGSRPRGIGWVEMGGNLLNA